MMSTQSLRVLLLLSSICACEGMSESDEELGIDGDGGTSQGRSSSGSSGGSGTGSSGGTSSSGGSSGTTGGESGNPVADAGRSDAAQGPAVIFSGAGDIASCSQNSPSEATAKVLDGIPGMVFTAGDNAYTDGTALEFGCFNTRWGRHKARMLPGVGNHDYHQSGAAEYFKYFGAAAGPATKGYYSVEVGAWHVVHINSNCSEIGGCTAASPQGVWLDADLKKSTAKCTMAIWHHPLFNIGNHGPSSAMKPIWQILYNNNADVVVNGHDHNYQHWKPQDANGALDMARGIQEFLVGTGGAGFYDFKTNNANVAVKDNVTNGVIKFTLRPNDLDFEFVPVAGQTFTERGSVVCH